MKKTKISIDNYIFPETFQNLLKDTPVFDSSCSREATVYYIPKDNGYYLKRSDKGALEREAILGRYYAQLGLAPQVLSYESLEEDWLLTVRMPGEDCTDPLYLAEPERLCDLLAEQLRCLHSLDPKDCPLTHTDHYLKTVEENYRNGIFDRSYYPAYQMPTDAFDYIQKHQHLLETDTLLHGDYCLPNILLNNWDFSGFIDLGNGGVGDRHVDLFWGAWTLNFNLKTDRYRERFFDAYGRDCIDPERLKLIGAIEIFC